MNTNGPALKLIFGGTGTVTPPAPEAEPPAARAPETPQETE